MTTGVQQKLSAEQVAEFYHDEFVQDQARDFAELAGPVSGGGMVVDIGGGVGFFAERLRAELGCQVRVLEMDPKSVAQCLARDIPAQLGDALAPPLVGDERFVCLNLILHHLVANDERTTRALQVKALRAWHGTNVEIFVNEYIYESFVGRVSGRFIFEITVSRLLSAIGQRVAKIVPALRANTFGVGVRFRSHDEWRELFGEAGYQVHRSRIGADEPVKLPLRLLLIRTIRRDSYILRPVRG